MKSYHLLVILFLSSCSYLNSSDFKVNHFGALKNLMHKGDLSSKVALSDLVNVENLYALGAVENLKGEVLILDSKPMVSSVEYAREEVVILDTVFNEEFRVVTIDNSFEKNACLLVYASVKEWETIAIPNTHLSYEEFEVFVESKAKELGVNTEEPFPFLIEGIVDSFDWHVIDWPEGDTEHSHDKHIHSGLYGTLENQEVEMLGFYSNKHHAIFTHHTTNMHVHVKSKKAIGHADDFVLGENMILKLPK